MASAFAALDTTGVAWALLRGRDELDHAGGDIDVLVAPADIARAETALVRTGFVPQRSWAKGTQRFLLGRGSDGKFYLLHVVSTIAFGSRFQYELTGAVECLMRVDRGTGLPVLHPVDELWISLLHCLLDKGAISDKHRARATELVPHALADDPLATQVAMRAGPMWETSRILHLVRQGAWEDLQALVPQLTRHWADDDRSVAWRGRRNRLSLLGHKAIEPFTKRGTSMALLAPDGAGKSTIAVTVAAQLPRPTRVLYLGAYGEATPRSPLPLPGADMVWRAVTMWKRRLEAMWHQSRRRFVIFDRHPVELRLNTTGGGRARFRRRLLGALPRADVTVVIDVPGDVLHARKPDRPAAEMEVLRQQYRTLGDLVPGIVLIDGNRPPDVVARDVAAVIWECHARRK